MQIWVFDILFKYRSLIGSIDFHSFICNNAKVRKKYLIKLLQTIQKLTSLYTQKFPDYVV